MFVIKTRGVVEVVVVVVVVVVEVIVVVTLVVVVEVLVVVEVVVLVVLLLVILVVELRPATGVVVNELEGDPVDDVEKPLVVELLLVEEVVVNWLVEASVDREIIEVVTVVVVVVVEAPGLVELTLVLVA